MQTFKPYVYCFLTMVGINIVSFFIGKATSFDWTGTRPSILELLVEPFIFLLLVFVIKKLLKQRKVLFWYPLIIAILKSLFINDMYGGDIVSISSNLIFYPTSIISYIFKGTSNLLFDYFNYVVLVFLYEVTMLKIFKL